MSKTALAKNYHLRNGKPIAQAEGEIDLSADILIIMRIMEVFLADKVLDPEHEKQ
jgi:succinate-semialdehyde dehydrogenase/glutarate-semialdehyde dehydrogenase